MGFDSSQLKTLLDKIIDIAISNGVNPRLAVNKFIEDIETQYDTKLGFEPQIEKLENRNTESQKGTRKGIAESKSPATCRTRHHWTITTRIN